MDIEKNNKLSSRKHWEKRSNYKVQEITDSPHKKYFKKYLPVDKTKSCIEIGAFPGNLLIYLAKFHKYFPVGLDYVEEVDFIADNLIYNGITTFEVIKEDFLTWKPVKKYDIVCSFGFVEHFKNYEEVIKKHMSIVNDEGYLIITVPCLGYFQLWLRKLVYTKESFKEVISMHNLEIMNLKKLEKIIFSDANFSKLFGGYTREMTIWFYPTDLFIRRKRILKIFKFLEKKVNKLGISNKFISPEVMVIAKKSRQHIPLKDKKQL